MIPPIALCAVGDEHVAEAITLLREIAFLKAYFYIITDEPEAFQDFNCTAVEYEDEKFNFHSKRHALELALQYSKNGAILMDVDTLLRNKNAASVIDFDKLEKGIHSHVLWKHPCDCSFENFIAGKVARVPYGREFKGFCQGRGLITDGAMLIQESMLYVKDKLSKLEKFFKVWDDLALFCTTQDIERHQDILGFGEGYSIGVAALNADITVHDPGSTAFGEFYSAFKHLAWEK